MADQLFSSLHIFTIKARDFFNVFISCFFPLEGEWKQCEKVCIKLEDDKDFLKVNDFLVDGAAPTTIIVRFFIKIIGMIAMYTCTVYYK
jgi:hypothetical protein